MEWRINQWRPLSPGPDLGLVISTTPTNALDQARVIYPSSPVFVSPVNCVLSEGFGARDTVTNIGSDFSRK